jgi:hypothetical protein
MVAISSWFIVPTSYAQQQPGGKTPTCRQTPAQNKWHKKRGRCHCAKYRVAAHYGHGTRYDITGGYARAPTNRAEADRHRHF